MHPANDNDAPQTLEDLALLLWDVCDVLEYSGLRGELAAADYLRDQCELIVRATLQERAR